MKKYIPLLVSIFVLLSACDKYDTMDDTVFIPDKDDSNLPAYTELGYNSFGAKYERLYFLASDDVVPCKITYKEERLQFSLIGRINYGVMSLSFYFPSSKVTKYQDLLVLNGVTLDLTDASCVVAMSYFSASPGLFNPNDAMKEHETIVKPLRGHLTFNKAQLLSVDDIESRVVLSGDFDIQFILNDRTESISYGRFDVGVNNKDVYYYAD